jgi:tRNA pseudouridine38-40 synthase
MARFKLIVEYDGSPYHGWQFLKNKPSVMGVLQDACKKALNTNTFELYGAGRTDAGVHALKQTAHLECNTKLSPANLRMSLNDNLPATVTVRDVMQVHPKFHARYDAVARSYVYHIATRRTAFGKKYAYWIKDKLNVAAMAEAARVFSGSHDFSSFGTNEDEKLSTKVSIYSVSVEQQGASIMINIIGSHFLWKMVRRMVGVLIECGRGNMSSRDIQKFLKTYSDIPAKLTVPPAGLFLENVFYDEIPDNYKPVWPMVVDE